ncbi:MAG: TetR/AcrR family transcriptional regulator [Acidimicrobiales bacterium]
MARPQLIDREGILDAALALADEHGIEAVTMRAVADRLAVTQMALYRHVANKADLLDGLVERLLAELPAPDTALSWVVQLRTMADGVRLTARRHAGVFPLLLQLPTNTSAAREVRDRVRAALSEAGVPGEDIPSAERLLSTAVLGFAASEASGRFRGLSQAEIDRDFFLLNEMLLVGLQGLRRDNVRLA